MKTCCFALFVGLAEALAVGAGGVLLPTPVAAQFWGDPFYRPQPPRAIPQQQPFNPFGGMFQQPLWDAPARPRTPRAARRPRRAEFGDFSKAPPPRKSDTPATIHIVVMGDSMADWLGHGLEEAYAEHPEVNVARKVRINTGLIRNESRSDSYDWVTSAREQLATDHSDFIVMIIGLSDRLSFREAPSARPPAPQSQGGQQSSQDRSSTLQTGEVQAKREQPAGTTIAATHEFRSEKWGELYGKRVDDMISTLKSKGVPVLWVGLPPIRGARARIDVAYLNDLYRARAQKAGIIYVDVWDGFVDEDGNFSMRGPDYNGQIRHLRSADGVYFTSAGAHKLGHYVEREIQHLLAARGTPVALPAPEHQQQKPAKPGAPPRPIAGPVVPLTGANIVREELAGSSPVQSNVPDSVATRVLLHGEAAQPASGRADDFGWPPAGADDSDIIAATPGVPPPLPRPTQNGPAPSAKAAPQRPGQAANPASRKAR
jgi:hypothetical protein